MFSFLSTTFRQKLVTFRFLFRCLFKFDTTTNFEIVLFGTKDKSTIFKKTKENKEALNMGIGNGMRGHE